MDNRRIDPATDARGSASVPARLDDAAPFCTDLCSKKLVFRTHPPRTAEDVLDASNHCWCRRTQQVLGPDGEHVSPDDCRAGRGCFRSVFAPSRPET